MFPAGDLTPILSGDATGFDAVEVDGPAVVVDKSRPNGDQFMLWYEATDGSGELGIGLLTSNDESFNSVCGLCLPRQPVLLPSDAAAVANGFNQGATDPTVVLDRRPAEQSPPLATSRRYKMWFEGRSGAGGAISSIVYCDSPDGVNWFNFEICTGLTPGVNVSFGGRVADPTVVLDKDVGGDLYRMWFEAVDSGDGHGSLGYADSTDGKAWTVRDAGAGVGPGATHVMAPGFGGVFSDFSIRSPTVVLVENASDVNIAFHLWYTGGDVSTALGTEDSIGYATSANGLTWIPEASLTPDLLPVLRPTGDSNLDPTTLSFEWDSGDIRQPSAWIDTDLAPTADGAFLLWYAGDIENGGPAAVNRIGFASGRNP